METAATGLSDEIKQLELERYVLEMEVDGLTVVPPSVTGVTPEFLDRCTEVLLAEFTRMTGSPISIENGPEAELVWPEPTGKSRSFLRDKDAPPPTQMLIQQIMQLDRCFRDLFVNPVVDALIDHAIGTIPFGGAKARRLSSHQLVRQVARRAWLRRVLGPAPGPGRDAAALGRPSAHRQRDVVPHRIHQVRRCPCLCPRQPPSELRADTADRAAGAAGGVRTRFRDRPGPAPRCTAPSRNSPLACA